MNTYSKYCPNVFLAKCEEQHEKGEEITVQTRYGKENECIIHNLIYYHEGFYFYSITRADGFNSQERAKQKAERLQGWASNAEHRSDEWREKSNEGADFLRLAEPIKVGHHSEKRHRVLIERNWNRMSRSFEESEKSEEYAIRAEYWENQASKIDLSMPESVEYYEYLVEKTTKIHAGMKNGTIPREHSYSLTYANKDRKNAIKNLEIANKLWS